MFVGEAMHPFNVFTNAGFEVDLVSETGSYSADQWSESKDWLNDEEIAVWKDPNSAFRKKLDSHMKPSDFKPEDVWIYTVVQRR
jgi:putative intracellular protease/amidase